MNVRPLLFTVLCFPILAWADRSAEKPLEVSSDLPQLPPPPKLVSTSVASPSSHTSETPAPPPVQPVAGYPKYYEIPLTVLTASPGAWWDFQLPAGQIIAVKW